ncbi:MULTISPECIES: cellulose biosynthesis protein BcsC [unclassified Pseudomonas]|uniref:cellulose biosynthesis protein BcsC n=1 Tax=unclassified Pseudomonas TaxID=196821 RepID=UPI0020968EC6|nr:MULTISPECIES: cellulose biosynthesis protein BcsC [unclassified Pseudomonas]MCO7506917.1 cellulose synthase subunit BcsC-related outer membrane protein [Pseudomonas sp. VE 267-6A]MCO7530006.1 cellulose synthase subunit BcsC-related outer membrane protein [Pseudomonas sp. 2]
MPSRRQTLAIGVLAALIHNSSFAELSENGKVLLEQGQYWQARKDTTRATEAWRKLLLIDPQQADALYGLGLLELDGNRPQGAKRYLDQLRQAHPGERQTLLLQQEIALHSADNTAQLEQARQLAESGELDQAVAAYRTLFSGSAPQGELGLEFYSYLGYTATGWQEARQGLERLQGQSPDNPKIKLNLAKLLLRNESTRVEGIRRLASYANDPVIGSESIEGWRQGLSWLGAPRPAEVPLFDAYLKAYPDDEEIRNQLKSGARASQASAVQRQNSHLVRGFKALDANDLPQAEQSFQARLREQAQDADALGGLGIVRQRQGRLGDADALFKQAISRGNSSRWQSALQGNRYWVLLDQANAARDAGNPQDARELLQRAIAMNPRQVQGPVSLADLQAAQGQFDSAETTYRQALSLDAGNPDALRGLVSVLAQNGKLGESQRLIDGLSDAQRERLGDLRVLRAAIAVGQARDAERSGDLAGARKALEEAVSNDPQNVWARYDLAQVYLKSDASGKARQTIDEMLKANPQRAEALYASALFSSRLGEWQSAQRSLAQVPTAQRSAAMHTLAEEIELHLLTRQAADLAKQGQRQQAMKLLQRAEPAAANNPGMLSALAATYIDIGQTEHALGMLRTAIAQSSTPSPSLRLAYAGALLKAGDDVQVNQILRELRSQPLQAGDQRSYDDLVFQYTVRQADLLREKGDLVAAYDTLAPALAQRPQDPQAVSSLARMYLDNRNPAKAVELFTPLLRQYPDNADVQMGAAQAFVQAGDADKAERAVEKALQLAPQNPQILTSAAGYYRGRGKLAKAEQLYAQALALQAPPEQNVLNPFGQAIAVNPFVGQPGQRKQSRLSETVLAEIPEPAQTQVSSRASEAFDAPVLLASRDNEPGLRTASQATPQLATPAPVDPRAALQTELDTIREARSPQIKQGVTFRGNDSESGLGKITDVEAPLEISVPWNDDRLALRITPVSLNAGGVKNELSANSRFGGITSEMARNILAMPLPDLLAEAEDFYIDSPGSQKDSGVGVAVAYENPSQGLKADLGVSPVGFLYNTAVGGISLDRPFAEGSNWRYNLNLSRRSVTDSLTSFAGARDKRTDLQWGGVTSNGGRLQLGYDNQTYGMYGYGSWHKLLGHDVESNTRSELGSGIYWYLLNNQDERLTAGLSVSGAHYANNQSFFTYGHGGYFSPQNFFSIGVPVSWAQRGPNFSYQVQGSVGMQHIEQDSAPYFRDRQSQAALERISQAFATDGTTLRTTYASQSKTGIGYSLGASGEYRLGDGFFFGGTLGVDNARDYQQWTGGLYLRYLFDDGRGAMPLPVNPYRSPYSN